VAFSGIIFTVSQNLSIALNVTGRDRHMNISIISLSRQVGQKKCIWHKIGSFMCAPVKFY
jgi:hypothetical protein